MRRLAAAFALLAALPCTASRPALAQAGVPYRATAIFPHAHGVVVALALRIPAGSQNDEPGLEGTAWLLARALEEQVARALGTAPAVFSVSVERTSIVFTLIAEADTWAEAWRTADSVVFRAPLDPDQVARSRALLREAVAFEAASPYREFEAAVAALLSEPGSPWARPLQGSPASLAAVGVEDLERYRSAHLRPESGAWAIVGPLAPGATPPSTLAPQSVLPPAVAWTQGARAVLTREVTSAWIAVAYPAPSDLPRTRLEFVAHLLREELDPTPPPADRYGMDVRIEDTPRGAVLVVEVVVVPEAAAAWESRIVEAVEALATDPPSGDFFRWRRRRFRAERLLEESAPEVEAARIAADLLRDGRMRDLGVEIWGLDGQALLAAARALGPPRILVLGPELAQNGSREPR